MLKHSTFHAREILLFSIMLNTTIRPIKSSWIYGIFLTSSRFS